MKSRLLLNVIIRESSAIFELLSGKDKTLLLWRNSFLILDLRLYVRDRVVGLDIQGDRLSREGLDEDLHGTTSKTKDQVEGGLLLDVVIREGSSIFKLLSGEDQSLLLRGDSFLVLDLGFHVGDRVIGFDIQGDRLSGEGLDEDLHGSSSKSQDKVQGRFLLDIVVRQGSSVLQLLSGEDQTLLLRGDSLLVLDLGLDVGNGVVGFDVKGDGFARKGLHENLHRHDVRFCFLNLGCWLPIVD